MLKMEHYKKQLSLRCCLVVGDLMLDKYIYGNVNRISPEAPVPVVRMAEQKFVLGGAANVAANIHAFGANAALIGVLGTETEAGIFREILGENGIDFCGIESRKRITTIKTRVIGNERQIIRFDSECTESLDSEDEELIIKKCADNIQYADAVVISDYAKGVCTRKVCASVIELANKHGKPALIDPKCLDWERYAGAYLIKPNFKEFCESFGKLIGNDTTAIESAVKKQLEKYNIKNILVTRSNHGMTLANNSAVYDFKAEAREVYDVSGAGDTVIATIAAFLAAGAELNEAVKLANMAAGIAVSKTGTYAVTFADMENAINGNDMPKIIADEDITEYIRALRKQGKKVVFTNGCFDIIHTGHISLLKQAKQFGDVLIVGLNSDSSVRRIKGEGRPINNETDRAEILTALNVVNAVIIFDEDTPLELIKKIMPDVLVKGADYAPDKVVGADIVIAAGGRLELVKLVESKSTTDILCKIKRFF
jgi:D-beta-D-heptose 7-phosphate kinase/D-beta-D-heptose 1-phosphate adenosyltransferase